MSKNGLVVNGHFRNQQVTGVQRYALEILGEFDRLNQEYIFISPPDLLKSDKIRQLWMQAVMPGKVGKERLLWSPTNIGPVFCENQVLTLHDISDQLHPGWFDSLYVKWRSLMLPQLLKRVRGIITVSKFSERTIKERFPVVSSKIEVIPNGVRSSHFYPREHREITAIKDELQLKKPFVVTVGSLDPRKNINGLLKGWNKLPSYIKKEAELVIIGAAADKFNFHLEVEIEPSVRFLGYIPDDKLPAIYSAALGFVFPSLFEGFGLPVLEAMACGTPVVTSDTTSLGEIAGDHALTVNPEKPVEIGEGIQHLIESEKLREELGRKGYEHARTFSWEKTAKMTLEYLNRIEEVATPTGNNGEFQL